MRQTNGGLQGLINRFDVARDRFRRADDLSTALNSQSNCLKLLEESTKTAAGGGLPKENAPQPLVNRTPQLISCQSQQFLKFCKDHQPKKNRAIRSIHCGGSPTTDSTCPD